MNNTDKTIQWLIANVPTQLRTYIYIQWDCWLCFNILSVILSIITWRLRDKMINDEIPIGWIAFIMVGLITFMLITSFIPYTLHIYTTPELVAIESLVGSNR